ncbi:MAG: biotin synthase BioB [Actinobacteria bacterium]|jgi:biotin synthase|nr:biotin synthase BioB [Actinomycetota bacterium]MCL6095024.1 biotin synthase BioB [Actinomycetota bacterium]
MIDEARRTLIDEHSLLTEEQLYSLVNLPSERIAELAELAHEVRLAWCGPTVELEGILSAKTGGCPEDCKFCGQSSHYGTPVKAMPFLDEAEILQAARESASVGASEFCIVLAVRGPDERTMGRLERVVPMVANETGLNVNVSAGILNEEQAYRLAAVGVHRYNHNLETARSHFANIVTTHSFEERVETCRLVRKAGMELCSGALIGLGESDIQRMELALQLRELDPQEVPINFLNPRPGTPLEGVAHVEPMEALRWIALFRLAMPGVILRYAGGREVTLRELQAMGMTSGINALIIGNYLTTLGRSPKEDIEMLEQLSMPIGAVGTVI